MARFSMIPADSKCQLLCRDKVVYSLKDNEDHNSPINNWIGTEESVKKIMKWLNNNVKDVEEDDFNFLSATTFEKVERLEEKLGCSVELNNASINNTYLIKLDKPILSLRDKVADALNINYDSISIYNSTMWADDYYGGDDIAIINRSKV